MRRSDRAALQLFLRAIAKDRQNFVGRFRAGETFANGAIVQKFGDRSQRAQMGLKLILRHDEKHDEFHRRIIERVELDPVRTIGRRPRPLPRCRSDEACGMAMPKPMPVLIVSSRCLSEARMLSRSAGLDLAQADEQIDQLDDGRPTLGRLHLGDDLLGRK